MATMAYEVDVTSPAVNPGRSCGEGGETKLTFWLDGAGDYPNAQSLTWRSEATAAWRPLPVACQLAFVDFLALGLREGDGPVEVLVGAPPAVLGEPGTWPTMFLGGEALIYELREPGGGTLSVPTLFTIDDQQPQQVANRVNAALALLGRGPGASVEQADRVRLVGYAPGADSVLRVILPNEDVGLAQAVDYYGTGSPISVARALVLTPGGAPGRNFWYRAPAAFEAQVFAAGS